MTLFTSTARPILRALSEESSALLQITREHMKEWDLYESDCAAFSLADAAYWLSCLWHGGQNSPLYRLQCLDFSPGMGASGPDGFDAISLFNSWDAHLAAKAGEEPNPFPMEE